MTRTVDLVISGDGRAARAAAVDALRCGGRVLIVLRSGDARQAQRLRSCLRKTPGADSGQLRVMTSAEVVCVDGVDAVEAVVVRHAPTGRLSAVNASAFVSAQNCARPPGLPHASKTVEHNLQNDVEIRQARSSSQ